VHIFNSTTNRRKVIISQKQSGFLAHPVRVHSRDGNGSSFVTHDPCDQSHSWHMIHGHYIIHDPMHGNRRDMALWYWTNRSVSIAKKNRRLKSPAMKIELIEWVSSFLMSTKNKKIASYCAVVSSSWVNGSLAVTHDPRDPFPSLVHRHKDRQHVLSSHRRTVCCWLSLSSCHSRQMQESGLVYLEGRPCTCRTNCWRIHPSDHSSPSSQRDIGL